MNKCAVEQMCTMYMVQDADNQNCCVRLRCRLNVSSESAPPQLLMEEHSRLEWSEKGTQTSKEQSKRQQLIVTEIVNLRI